MSTVTFNELPIKYEKKKKIPFSELDLEGRDEYLNHLENKNNYKKQFKENLDYTKNQLNTVKQEISPSQWDNLDNIEGPITAYDHPLELQTGSELQANLNALTNRGNEPKANKKLGIWGGIKSKKRKSNKRKSKKRKRKSKRRYN
jgi:hypothetical protein